jgi:hypothetical protein
MTPLPAMACHHDLQDRQSCRRLGPTFPLTMFNLHFPFAPEILALDLLGRF